MRRGVLVLLSVITFGCSSGSKNETTLSRSTALKLLKEAETKPVNVGGGTRRMLWSPTISVPRTANRGSVEMLACEVVAQRFVPSWTVMVKEGFNTIEQSGEYGCALKFTSKGEAEARKSHWTDQAEGIEIPLGKFKVLEITGLTDAPMGMGTMAQFSWKVELNASGKHAEEMGYRSTEIPTDKEQGSGLFKRFDDGWRLVQVDQWDKSM